MEVEAGAGCLVGMLWCRTSTNWFATACPTSYPTSSTRLTVVFLDKPPPGPYIAYILFNWALVLILLLYPDGVPMQFSAN